MKEELYRKVYIKSESDLPKEEGNYYLVKYNKNFAGIIAEEIFYKESIKAWMDAVVWYLQPIEQSESKTAIETSKALRNIFDDLWDNAYNAEYHHYEYKQANQIIRKHIEAMEEYRQQLRQRLRRRLLINNNQ